MTSDPRQDESAEAFRRLAVACLLAQRQLRDALAILSDEIDSIAGIHPECVSPTPPSDRTTDRPYVDRTTFSVVWRGRSCFLGNTLLFRLAAKLVRRPGRYCAYAELLDEVWEGPRSWNSVRHAVKRLRDKLKAAGMPDLARGIDGGEAGHYVLKLGADPEVDPTEIQRRSGAPSNGRRAR